MLFEINPAKSHLNFRYTLSINMGYLSAKKTSTTNSLIKAYQVSNSEGEKREILTELYSLWEKAIYNLSWFVLGKNKHNLECIKADTGLIFTDIKQEAFFGFKQVVETYDPSKAGFFTYLAGGIRHHLHCYLSQMRKGNHHLQFFGRFRHATFNQEKGKRGFELDDLWQIHLNIDNYEEPLEFEIEYRNKKTSKLKFAKSAFSNKVLCALNAIMFQGTTSLDNMINMGFEPRDIYSWRPDQALEEKELTIKLEKLLLTMDEFGEHGKDNRIRLVLTAYYGLNFFSDETKALGLEPRTDHTLNEIGDVIGLTRARVGQLKEDGLKKLRNNVRMNVLRGIVDEHWFDNGE